MQVYQDWLEHSFLFPFALTLINIAIVAYFLLIFHAGLCAVTFQKYFCLVLAMLCLLLMWIGITTKTTPNFFSAAYGGESHARQPALAPGLAPSSPRTDILPPSGKKSSRDNVYLCGVVAGRLGNAFFSYASLVGIARANNMTLLLRDTSVLPHMLRAPPRVAQDFDEKCSTAVRLLQPKCCGFEESLMRLEHNKHYFLATCLTAWPYFQGIEHELASLLAVKENILRESQAFVKGVRARVYNLTLVGLHVRRTDQAGPGAYSEGRYPVTPEYIKKAMTYFTSRFLRVHFVVASDDISWCRNHIRHDDVTFMKGHSAAVDMTILTLTDHMIMSIGTYGWWAGYFNKGIKVYMKDFIMPGTMYANVFDDLKATGYIYPGWVGL